MPQDNPASYRLTDGDKALIRGMTLGREGQRNIAAVHFDGQVLVDLVGAFVVFNPPEPAGLLRSKGFSGISR